MFPRLFPRKTHADGLANIDRDRGNAMTSGLSLALFRRTCEMPRLLRIASLVRRRLQRPYKSSNHNRLSNLVCINYVVHCTDLVPLALPSHRISAMPSYLAYLVYRIESKQLTSTRIVKCCKNLRDTAARDSLKTMPYHDFSAIYVTGNADPY